MNCTISSGNLKVFGRALQSFAKIPGEELFFEATDDGLYLRTLNTSRSAYAYFVFKPQFFVSYITGRTNRDAAEKTSDETDLTSENRCKIPMKSALILFKSLSNLEKSIELCKLWIDVGKCRLVCQFLCKCGVVRTNSFVLFSCESMETLYDRTKCQTKIVAPGIVLVDGVLTNFKSGQEDVTLSVSVAELTLKNCVDDEPDPDKCVKTQLRLCAEEFDQFCVTERAEVTFCLKELRALLTFVETFRVSVSIYFDEPGKPVIFALESDPNFTAELVLASYLIQEQTQGRADDVNTETNESQSTMSKQNSEPLFPNFGRKHYNATQNVFNLSRTNASTVKVNDTLVNHASHSASRNQPPLVMDSETPPREETDEQTMEADDDILPPSPPPKKPRSFLFEGWSQKTTLSATTFSQTAVDDDHDVLAPDSDLEDY